MYYSLGLCKSITFNGLVKMFDNTDIKNYVDKESKILPDQAIDPNIKEYYKVIKTGKDVVPNLVELLQSDKYWLRVVAWEMLKRITNREFGSFEIYFDKQNKFIKQREEVDTKWENWWKENKNRTRMEWLIKDLHTGSSEVVVVQAIMLIARNDQNSFSNKKIYKELKNMLADKRYNAFAAYALVKLNDLCSIEHLIKINLYNKEYLPRSIGFMQLNKIANQTFDYDPNQSVDHNKNSIQKWKNWWELNKSKYCR